MNKFNRLLLGSTALTFVTTGLANAITINEGIDYSDTFAGRQTIGPASSGSPFLATTIFGQMNRLPGSEAEASASVSSDASGPAPLLDGIDFFRLSGLAANQSVTINLQPVAQASGTGPAPELFAISLLDNVGGFLDFIGDSVPDAVASASASASGDASGPSGPPVLNFADSFTFEATALSNGELNFRLENGRDTDQFYRLSVAPSAASEIAEPSSLAGLAAGAAGLGFIAARRRRRGK